MNKKSWYASKLSDMDVIKISESDDWVVDYDKNRGMYRISYFQDNHFVDEHWFDAYEEKEVDDRIEKIIEFLEWTKKLYEMCNNMPKYLGTVPDPLDFKSDEEKIVDLLGMIIKCIKDLK